MAPEVMMKLDHGVACDYFALGCVVYECLTGKVIYEPI
jgi:p70 ribosomal S6 kinase/serum/glucocorticoid-regulated kinase 2